MARETRTPLSLAMGLHGVTTRVAAAALGVHRDNILAWTKGTSLPRPEQRTALARLLNEPERVLFPGLDYGDEDGGAATT